MALNPAVLATNLIAAFSTSPNPATKALVDAHYTAMAGIINTHIGTASVQNVICDTNTGLQIPPFPNVV